MALLPKLSFIEKLQADMDQVEIQEHRSHMGYSSSGEPCKRKVWYEFHWAYQKIIPSKLRRIFETGNIGEDFMKASLESAGYHIHHQQAEVVGVAGHVLGHIDGIIYKDEGDMIIEFKTMNDKNFKELCKKKCKTAKPQYFYQAQAYMGKMNVDKCLLMVYNKNDSTYYFEVIEFDKSIFKEIEETWFDIISSEYPFDKIGTGSPAWFECKFCQAIDICHYNAAIEINCRTCKHVDIEMAGRWSCGLLHKELSTDEQRIGCSRYELNEFVR